MVKSPLQSLQSNVVLILGVGLVLGFVVGNLYTRLNLLEKGGSAGTSGTQGVQGETTGATGDTTQPEAPRELTIKKPDPKKDHWQWSKDAQYVLVEYSDFECPFCGSFAPTVKKLGEDYGDKLGLVYRHFPLSFHPKAMPAALASECVAALGSEDDFWKFHDVVFAKMPAVEISGLADIAADLGLNKAAIQDCIDSAKYKDKVQAQLDEGTTAGIAATPTTVVYDMKTGKSTLIEGALPYEQAKKIIDTFMGS